MGDYDFAGRRPPAVGEEAAWFQFCRQRRLMIQHCDECQRYLFPPRSVCPDCLAAQPAWVEAAGSGTVFTFTVQNRDAAGFEGQAPYTIAMVELDEGPRLMSRIVASGVEPYIGMPVAVRWARIDEEQLVPVFVPAESALDEG